jgi:cell division protein ZapE
VAKLAGTYLEKVEKGELHSDEAQQAVVQRLDVLREALTAFKPRKASGLFDRLFGKPSEAKVPKGLYIHGDVGRGKTMLMDLLYETAAGPAKRRDHFLSFMQDVHSRIHEIRRRQREGEVWEDADPVKLVAEAISTEAQLLCFDEFQVTDITDALILGRLFEALFGFGVVVVATSNVRPDNLYKDGLNRNSFLPFVDVLKQYVDVVSLDSPTDYRLGRLAGRQIYLHPLGRETDAALQALWVELTETEQGEEHVLTVKGRDLVVPQAARGASRFAYADLCEAALGAADYIAIASAFKTVFIEGIPIIEAEKRNEAKRFITLIDAFYDRKIKIVVGAAAAPEQLYPEGPHRFEFDRTISRLNEMQSGSYFDV